MNYTPYDCESPFVTMDSCLDKKLHDMSPVTDLALNMRSLKTTVSTGTPTRRISWSDPYSNGSVVKCFSNDCSPANDSPMLQEILNKNEKKLKNTSTRKIFPLIADEEKENIIPGAQVGSKSTLSRNDSQMESCSQDSGYSSTTISVVSTPRIRVKSSLFNDANVEEFDGLFPMEEDFDLEIATSGSSFQSLLTKPLCNVENTTAPVKKGKLPIRRCLTMEMDSSSTDSSSMNMDLFSQNNILFSSVTDINSSASDLEPIKRLPFKRPDRSSVFSWQSKRRKSSPSINFSSDIPDISTFMKQRSFSETAASIMQAVQKADLQPELIGDCSRNYALPRVKGRHQDLKCISPETLVQLIKGEYHEKVDKFILVDCRYPYEFEGGHIQGAQNIYTKEEIMEKFLENVPEQTAKNVLIFHCEFSSERAPNLCRFLRNKDREMNECNYPKLCHPEIYILEGGYKAFFANYREYCIPQDYKPMAHKDHSSDLRLFRAKSKSFGADSKSRFKMKSSSEISNM